MHRSLLTRNDVSTMSVLEDCFWIAVLELHDILFPVHELLHSQLQDEVSDSQEEPINIQY